MSNVPESIRATAIETALRKLDEILPLCYCQSYRYEKHDENPPCGRTRMAIQVVDAVLPAVVAQVQADAWDEGYEAADSNTPRSRKGHWEDDRPRRGMRTWIPDPLPTNPYREKGENNHE